MSLSVTTCGREGPALFVSKRDDVVPVFFPGKARASGPSVHRSDGAGRRIRLQSGDPDRDADTEPLDHQISVVFPAVYTQLGLRVDGRKTPTEVLVIDSADKVPTAN